MDIADHYQQEKLSAKNITMVYYSPNVNQLEIFNCAACQNNLDYEFWEGESHIKTLPF
jgi:hypothetical protein